jgi:hypothetical protein
MVAMLRKSALAFFLIQSLATSVLAANPDIGKTVAVENEVTLESGGSQQPLFKGSAVHQNEIIVTGDAARAEVELLDKTKLAIGPEARLVLDKFVYDASASPGSISVNLSKGAFRFLTGIAPKNSYEFTTPTASLGVRGTIFDVYVGENGETAVLLLGGAVQVCNRASSCQLQDQVGTIFFVSVDGVISSQSKCENSFLQRVGFERAFPFIGKPLFIDPIRRMSLRDFECRPGNRPPITTTQGTTQPSPPYNTGTAPSSPGAPGLSPHASPPSIQATGSPSPVPELSPAEVMGLVVAGGLVIGLPIIESQPASP